MKNKIILILFIVLSCGRVYALPQDWPCFALKVEKYETISDNNGVFEYAYKGDTKGYSLNINLSGSSKFPTSFANCGNTGCVGTITEKNTGRKEDLNFFCDGYTKVTCYVGLGEDAVFHSTGNGNYVVNYCLDDKQKTLRFNLKDCDECHCKMYWYDGEVKKAIGEYSMACKKEENKARCFTYYGYESWRHFQNEDNDFENCVKLGF